MDLAQGVLGTIKGIGEKKAEALAGLGIVSVGDLMTYYPFRYEDLSTKPLRELLDGEKTTMSGVVLTESVVQFYGKRRNKLSFRMLVEGCTVVVSFFNQAYLKSRIVPGEEIVVFGKWEMRKMSLSGLKILTNGVSLESLEPVYRVNKNVRQRELVQWIQLAFQLGFGEKIEENLPDELLDKYRLICKNEAVLAMHFPTDKQQHREAIRRLKFEELFYFQMKITGLRYQEKKLSKGVEVLYDVEKLKDFTQGLPFELTDAQKRVTNEIARDLRSKTHMIRLLQGDVGSGKTVISAIAMFAVATSGKQSALMVPTEILAQQHLESLQELLKETDLTVELLTRTTKTAKKREVLEQLQTGEIDILIGTHALIQEGVNFHDLALVVTDEQHRFGVNQRKVLREKGDNPDVLFMTATPIPRTLAITAYGEMDVSVIDELPKGRIPVETKWIRHKQMRQMLQWLTTELEAGNQVYFISPLIEESELVDLQNATQLAEDLTQHFKDKFCVALLHGKMKSEEKEAIMEGFKNRQSDILVSTTVIEVGVNIPNATVMVIMDANRFGLAQLHQLRGRVGRGSKKSYCILVANPTNDYGKERMKVMCETNNGFILSEKDLELRGAGEVFGTKQSGIPDFSVANIVEDFSILEEARKVASEIWQDPNWQEKEKYKNIVQNFGIMTDKSSFD